jgi:hypothetical protein
MPKTNAWLRPVAVLVQAVLASFGAGRPRLFISYRRRGDGAGYGGHIAERLIAHFGPESCFRDLDSLESGVDFVHAIADAIRGCRAMLVIIAPDWLTQTKQGRVRLDDPNDFVRNELVAAFQAGIRVIPVLVGGARMPTEEQLPEALKPLARRHAHELSDARWSYDVGKLVETLEALGIPSSHKIWIPRLSRVARQVVLRTGTALALVGAIAAIAVRLADQKSNPPAPPPPPPPVVIVVDAGSEPSPPPDRRLTPPTENVETAQRQRGNRKPPRSTPGQVPVVNTIEQPSAGPSRWLVRWSNANGSYEGHLSLAGNAGNMRVTYRDPGSGNVAVIDEAMFVRQEGTDLVLQGVAPVLAGTKVPASFYQADHAHVRLGVDGLVYAAFCDVVPAHQCFPATLVPLPSRSAPTRQGSGVRAASM